MPFQARKEDTQKAKRRRTQAKVTNRGIDRVGPETSVQSASSGSVFTHVVGGGGQNPKASWGAGAVGSDVFSLAGRRTGVRRACGAGERVVPRML